MRELARDSAIWLCLLGGMLLAGCSTGDPVNAFDLDVGETKTQMISTHCGYEWLEVDINGQTWRTVDLPRDSVGNPTEPTWPNGFEQAEFVFALREQDVLEVRATESEITYRYSPDPEPPGCA